MMKFLYSLAFMFGADNWKLDKLPTEIEEALGKFDQTNTMVLDLGCGEGQECISLATKGWQVIGVDYVPLSHQESKKSGS